MLLARSWRTVVLGCACVGTLLAGPALAQTSPRAAMLEASAWDALEASKFDTAAAAFREALAGDPNNPRLLMGAALAAFATRRDADANAAVQRVLAQNPKNPDARELLGRILYRTGQLDEAIRTFDALVADGERDPSIAETLDRWRREADLRDRMHVAVGHGITVAFEGPDDAVLAEKAVASVERAADRIWQVLSYYPTRPITIVLYTNEQFRDITRAPAWAAGSFDGTVRVPMRGALQKPEELDRVLAHEYVHALVHEMAPSGVPAWLNEGLAAALEHEEPPGAAADATVAVSLRTLEKSFGRLSGADAQGAYAASERAVRRLIEQVGGFALTNLLRDLGGGEPFEAAFEHRTGRSFADFEASLREP